MNDNTNAPGAMRFADAPRIERAPPARVIDGGTIVRAINANTLDNLYRWAWANRARFRFNDVDCDIEECVGSIFVDDDANDVRIYLSPYADAYFGGGDPFDPDINALFIAGSDGSYDRVPVTFDGRGLTRGEFWNQWLRACERAYDAHLRNA